MNKQLTRKINHGVRDDGLLNLTDEDFYSTVLPAPPMKEQQKIAEILATCDKVIELKQKLLEEKCRQKRWLMQRLLTGNTGLSEENGLYKTAKIRELADSLTGYPFDSEKFSPEGIRLMRCGNIGIGKTSWEKKATAFWPSADNILKTYSLQAGDVVIGMDGASVGKSCAMITESDLPCYLVQRVTRLRTRYPLFLLQWFRSDSFLDYVKKRRTVTAIPHISEQDILEYEILIPTNEADIRRVETVLNRCDTAINIAERELDTWKQKKKALMQLLLTGLVRVNA